MSFLVQRLFGFTEARCNSLSQEYASHGDILILEMHIVHVSPAISPFAANRKGVCSGDIQSGCRAFVERLPGWFRRPNSAGLISVSAAWPSNVFRWSLPSYRLTKANRSSCGQYQAPKSEYGFWLGNWGIRIGFLSLYTTGQPAWRTFWPARSRSSRRYSCRDRTLCCRWKCPCSSP
jgi:hypothetical protein